MLSSISGDLALLELEDPIDFKKLKLSPVCIPRNSDEIPTSKLIGQTALVIGINLLF
jgi:hypothetical protein